MCPRSIREMRPLKSAGFSHRNWYSITEQPAPTPHLAHPEGCAAICIVPVTVPRHSRSCEHFPDGFDLHLLQGYLAQGTPLSWHPTVGLCIRSCGGPRGGGAVSYERGTPVLAPLKKRLPEVPRRMQGPRPRMPPAIQKEPSLLTTYWSKSTSTCCW